MQLFAINVGVNMADASRRGLRSPIFPDGTFEFVPIKEHRDFANVEGIPRYCQLPTCTGRAASLSAYLPSGIIRYRVHVDPEFNTFTYGDILSPRAANLRDVLEGDHVWFLARLWNHDGTGWTQGSDFYFIGMFEVSGNILIEAVTEPEHVPSSIRQRIQANAHYKRWVGGGDRRAFRVITGHPAGSFRFHRALRVTRDIAAHLFAGTYDPDEDVFRVGDRILMNLNGRPRRFQAFGSATRTVQAFLNSCVEWHEPHLTALADLASVHARGACRSVPRE